MFATIDKIVKRMIKEHHEKVVNGEKTWLDRPYTELADLSDSTYLNDETPVLMFNRMMINNGYVFLPYATFEAVEDLIETADKVYKKDGVDWFCCSYKLKDGMKIEVSGG